MARQYGTLKRPQRYTRQIVVMVTPELGDRIDAVAEEAGVSVGQAVRDVITHGLPEFEPYRVLSA